MHVPTRLQPLLLAVLLLLATASARATTLDNFDLDTFRGKVVLVDFWASWCGPCKESFPWMQRIESQYAAHGLVVIAVNVDRDRKLAEQFLQSLRPTFAIFYDPLGSLAEYFGVSGMPASFYIDRAGTIRYSHIGFRAGERENAERELAALVAERQPDR